MTEAVHPAADTLEIIYRDEHFVVINKPAGLLVHRSPIDRHETRFALQILRDQIGQRVYPVHRLDKPTAGALLFALSADSARLAAEAFADRKVSKHYLTVVRGHCPEQGRIDHPLSFKADKIADRDRLKEREAQTAVTDYQRLATIELDVTVDRYPQTRYSLVHLQPLTGRKHQLRRHMKHLGYPMIGDAKYGKGVHNRYFAEQLQIPGLLLHAFALHWQHPYSGETISSSAALDSRFIALIERFEWQANLPGELSGD